MKSLMLTIVLLAVLVLGAACSGGASILDPDPEPAAPADTTAPDIQINGIDDGASYGELEAGANVLNVVAIAADGAGIANMSMRLNGTLVAAANDSNLSFVWDVTEYDDGAYDLEVTATDNNGNPATESMTVYVNNDLLVVDPGWFPHIPDLGIIWP